MQIEFYRGFTHYRIAIVRGRLILAIDNKWINDETFNYDRHYDWVLSAYVEYGVKITF